jgi:chaperonin cofactor prefoldin
MGDPLSIASGVLPLSAFAFISSVSLYQSVRSFQSNKVIRELKGELEALGNAIQSLRQLVSKDDDQFKTLCLPLLRCGQACKDYEEVIANFTKHSSESKTSSRDWAKLQYLGSDIVGFKNMLARYKATIGIAIGNINLYVFTIHCLFLKLIRLATRRTSDVNASVIQEFKIMLKDTTTDLRDHLESLDDRLEALRIQEGSMNDKNIAERERMQAEIDSVKECLAVCAQASEHADKVRTNMFEDVSAAQNAHEVDVSTLGDLISAKRFTAGVGARQWLIQLSDATLQMLARGRGIDLSSGSRIANQASGKEVMTLLLDRWGADVPVTAEVVEAAAANYHSSKEVMALLFDRRGADIPITAEVVKAAAGNYHSGKEVMALLLDRRGADIPITAEVVKAAAGNNGSGKEVMTLLFDRRGADVPITAEVVKAVAANHHSSREVMTLLLDRREQEVYEALVRLEGRECRVEELSVHRFRVRLPDGWFYHKLKGGVLSKRRGAGEAEEAEEADAATSNPLPPDPLAEGSMTPKASEYPHASSADLDRIPPEIPSRYPDTEVWWTASVATRIALVLDALLLFGKAVINGILYVVSSSTQQVPPVRSWPGVLFRHQLLRSLRRFRPKVGHGRRRIEWQCVRKSHDV